jgi:hypothetical protein
MRQQIIEIVSDGGPFHKTTLVLAGMATASPWWIDALDWIDPVAQKMLAPAGVTWFAVQIVLAVLKYRRNR